MHNRGTCDFGSGTRLQGELIYKKVAVMTGTHGWEYQGYLRPSLGNNRAHHNGLPRLLQTMASESPRAVRSPVSLLISALFSNRRLALLMHRVSQS